MQARYDFSQHAVAPVWDKILAIYQHATNPRGIGSAAEKASADWRVEDVDAFRAQVFALKGEQSLSHPSVRALLKVLAEIG